MSALPLLLLALAAAASASVISSDHHRTLGDAEFLRRQKQVLDLYAGLGHHHHFKSEHADWDLAANFANFKDEKYPRAFLEAYKRGLLPQDGIFTLACHHTAHDAIKLFDLFYFANDFDTFYKAACWARTVVNPFMFGHAYSLALLHRPDCRNFVLPPLYEVHPNLFVPSDTMHEVFDFKMTGRKEGRFNYNNTGYEYNYHRGMFGGLLDSDSRGYGDFRISYLREDVGFNSWFAGWFARNPSWMCPEKYGAVRFQRRGENFYYMIQQVFARYTLERLASGLPYATVLDWHRPIQVGYNPRLAYFYGQSMMARPDNVIPADFNPRKVRKAEHIEKRLWDVIDARILWELANQTFIGLKEDNGIEILGRLVYGTTDRPSRNYYKSSYYAGLDTLAYLLSTASDRSYVGNAMSTPITALRDPAFYNYLARVLYQFDYYKKTLGHYSVEDLTFSGVTVENVEVDRLLTYFEMSDFEVTNGVPMSEPKDFIDHRYVARQFRLNHKPFRYNVTVNSQAASGQAIVRVFLGPKFDSDEHYLSPDQARHAFFEIDRFIAKLSAGSQTWERSSSESPVFVGEQDGFRELYSAVNNALNNKGEFYYYQGGRCGLPERLQLPMGWKGGRTYRFFVAVSPFEGGEERPAGHEDVACGGSALYDGKAMGFPFDRPLPHDYFHGIHNFFFKDVSIYHKDAADLNRIVA